MENTEVSSVSKNQLFYLTIEANKKLKPLNKILLPLTIILVQFSDQTISTIHDIFTSSSSVILNNNSALEIGECFHIGYKVFYLHSNLNCIAGLITKSWLTFYLSL